jgi:toxin ParE1/3/4
VIYQLVVSERALDDLVEIQNWVASQAGNEVALADLARIKARFYRLTEYPGIGTPRDDLVQGLRTVSFERRLIIGCRVDEGSVKIDRVVDGARDITVWQ